MAGCMQTWRPGAGILVQRGIYGHERGPQRRHTAATDLLSPRGGRRQMSCNYSFISRFYSTSRPDTRVYTTYSCQYLGT